MGDVTLPAVGLDIAASYGTTLVDRHEGLTLSLVTLPNDLHARFSNSDEVAGALGLDVLYSAQDPSELLLTYVVAALLGTEGREGSAELALERLEGYVGEPPGDDDLGRGLLAFASYCVTEPAVVLEQSPISKKVLAIIATAGASVTLAAIPIVGVPIAIVYGTTAIVGLGTGTAVMERLYFWIAPKG